jgi:hypothetical protein
LKARPTELRRFSAILAVMQLNFSATQTEWRRERDSNPRYRFQYSGFQVPRGVLNLWKMFYSTLLFNGLQISRFDPFCLETIRSDRATITIS